MEASVGLPLLDAVPALELREWGRKGLEHPELRVPLLTAGLQPARWPVPVWGSLEASGDLGGHLHP